MEGNPVTEMEPTDPTAAPAADSWPTPEPTPEELPPPPLSEPPAETGELPPVADEPPIPPQSSRSLNLFVSLLILINLSVLGYLGWWFAKEKTLAIPFLSKTKPVPTAAPVIRPTSTPTPSPMPKLTVPPDWNTYVDPNNEFQFLYPSSFALGKFGDSLPLLNHRISWRTSEYSYKDCRGDCPIITSEESVAINNQTALKTNGWVGSVGGNIPQSFIEYEIKYPNAPKYFIMTIWELIQDGDWEQMNQLYPDDRKINDVSQEEEQVFDQILSTFKFLN